MFCNCNGRSAVLVLFPCICGPLRLCTFALIRCRSAIAVPPLPFRRCRSAVGVVSLPPRLATLEEIAPRNASFDTAHGVASRTTIAEANEVSEQVENV